MTGTTRLATRTVLLLCIVVSAGVAVAEVRSEDQRSILQEQADLPDDERRELVPRRDGITVYTGQATPATSGAITAYTPDGELLYFNQTYANYFDVDPVPGERATVEYVATEILSGDECDAETKCVRNVVIRLNLSTGASDVLYSRVYMKTVTLDGIPLSGKIHDFDRLDEDRLLVADIRRDEVYVVNLTTGLRTWTWSAEQSFPRSAGGEYPGDWTHVNDVEVLEDGRFMVSLRNFDRVVFLDRTGSVDTDWTVGAEDAHRRLYEQHNPDYINATAGGPAVLIADSENNRIVEYQREGTDWVRSWSWADPTLQWPRDADRLPNGHTLITDTHGGRVVEVDERGKPVWQLEAATPYEAERLPTPAESGGGPAAAEADLQSRGDASPVSADPGGARLSNLRNIVGFVLPDFFTLHLLVALVVLVGASTALTVTELYWRGYRMSLNWPIRFSRS